MLAIVQMIVVCHLKEGEYKDGKKRKRWVMRVSEIY
jgi:hypothetical protein